VALKYHAAPFSQLSRYLRDVQVHVACKEVLYINSDYRDHLRDGFANTTAALHDLVEGKRPHGLADSGPHELHRVLEYACEHLDAHPCRVPLPGDPDELRGEERGSWTISWTPDPQLVAAFAHLLGDLQPRGRLAKRTWTTIANWSEHSLAAFGPKELVMMARAFSNSAPKLDGTPALLAAIAAQAEGRVSEFDARGLTMLAHTYARKEFSDRAPGL
jgi:hypothetical protein